MMIWVLSQAERSLTYLGRLSLRKLLLGGGVLAAIELFCLLALANQSHRIVQRGRAFNVGEITIAVGDTVEFSDEDEFLHQIFIRSPTLNFDSAEQSPGQIIMVKFSVAGSFDVQCHIHPKMYLKVDVK